MMIHGGETSDQQLLFVDVMGAAILKILLARRGISLLYDTEKCLLGNKGLQEFLIKTT